jgi:hypothetical protein
MCMEEPGGTANEAPPPRRGHPRGVVITSILGRAAKTPLILPIRGGHPFWWNGWPPRDPMERLDPAGFALPGFSGTRSR